MVESFVQAALDGAGKMLRTRSRTVGANTVHEQYVIAQDEKILTYRGRGATFLVQGRTTTPSTVLTIFNTSATVLVDVNRIMIDSYQTAGKLVSVAPQVIRAVRLTAAPAGGAAITKVPLDTADTSNASVALLQDAASDTAQPGTALSSTSVGTLTQEISARTITNGDTGAVASTRTPIYASELADRIEFFAGTADVTLRQNQGLALQLINAGVASDRWVAVLDWEEYTLP